MKLKLTVLGLVLALVSCNNSSKGESEESAGSIMEQQTAPVTNFVDASFVKLNGDQASLSSLKGKTVVINFWATWCGPCIKEMPSLQALYNKYQSNPNIEWLVVEIDNQPDLAKKFVENNKFTFPIYSLAAPISEKYLGGAIPTTVILDKQGEMVYREEGMTDFVSDNFINRFEGIINK